MKNVICSIPFRTFTIDNKKCWVFTNYVGREQFFSIQLDGVTVGGARLYEQDGSWVYDIDESVSSVMDLPSFLE